jgi:hypothetical protein
MHIYPRKFILRYIIVKFSKNLRKKKILKVSTQKKLITYQEIFLRISKDFLLEILLVHGDGNLLELLCTPLSKHVHLARDGTACRKTVGL